MMVSRRVNREAVVVLGWGRAILLQLAHPLVAAGVGAHSDFDGGPLAYVRRMRRTIGAMLSLTFGTESEIRETAGRINAIHHRVHGRLDCAVGGYAAGTPYDATDPALLTWVHATLVDSQLRTYALFVGPLAPADEDRYCAEAAQIGPLLGVPSNTLPDTKDRPRPLSGLDATGRSTRGRRVRTTARCGPARAAGETMGRPGAVARPLDHRRSAAGRPSATPTDSRGARKDARRLRSAAAVLRGGPAVHAAGAARVATREQVINYLREHEGDYESLRDGSTALWSGKAAVRRQPRHRSLLSAGGLAATAGQEDAA